MGVTWRVVRLSMETLHLPLEQSLKTITLPEALGAKLLVLPSPASVVGGDIEGPTCESGPAAANEGSRVLIITTGINRRICFTKLLAGNCGNDLSPFFAGATGAQTTPQYGCL